MNKQYFQATFICSFHEQLTVFRTIVGKICGVKDTTILSKILNSYRIKISGIIFGSGFVVDYQEFYF